MADGSTGGAFVRSGVLMRYSKKVIGGVWKKDHCNLYGDGTLTWSKDLNTPAKGSVNLKTGCKHVIVGSQVQVFNNRPDFPRGYQLFHVIAVPERQGTNIKVRWFLCANDDDHWAWIQAMNSVLPENLKIVLNTPSQNIQPGVMHGGGYPIVQYPAGQSMVYQTQPTYVQGNDRRHHGRNHMWGGSGLMMGGVLGYGMGYSSGLATHHGYYGGGGGICGDGGMGGGGCGGGCSGGSDGGGGGGGGGGGCGGGG